MTDSIFHFLCGYKHPQGNKNCPACCPKCGGEKDSEGWCANYCLEDDDD